MTEPLRGQLVGVCLHNWGARCFQGIFSSSTEEHMASFGKGRNRSHKELAASFTRDPELVNVHDPCRAETTPTHTPTLQL